MSPLSARSAVAFVGMGYLLSFLIRFASNIILTHFLDAEAFGVMLVVMNIVTLLTVLSDVGLVPAIMRHSDDGNEHFRGTLWTVQVVIGFIQAVVMCLAAAALYYLRQAGQLTPDSAYAVENLPAMLVLVAAGVALSGWRSLKLIYAQKQMRQWELVRNELFVQTTFTVFTCLLAAQMRSAWALAIGLFFNFALGTCVSHWALAGVRDRLHWMPAVLRQEWPYIKWIWLSSAVSIWGVQMDRWIMSGLVPVATLGMYSLAAGLVLALESGVSKVVISVGQPLLNTWARQGPAFLLARYSRVVALVEALVLAMSAGLCLLAHDIVRLIYPASYAGAGQFLALLSFGIVQARASLATQFLLATGVSRDQALLSVLRLVLGGAAIAIGYSLGGITGAVAGAGSQAALIVLCAFGLEARAGLRIGRDRILAWMLGLAAGSAAGVALSWLLHHQGAIGRP